MYCIVVIRQQYDIIYHLEKLNIQYYIVPFECDYGLKENNSLEKMELNFIEDYDSAKHLVEIIHNEKIKPLISVRGFKVSTKSTPKSKSGFRLA